MEIQSPLLPMPVKIVLSIVATGALCGKVIAYKNSIPSQEEYDKIMDDKFKQAVQKASAKSS